MILYKGLAYEKLGEHRAACACFNKLIDYGERHLRDEVRIDYFADRSIIREWDKLLKAASIMGCMVMGGLIVNYVKCKCGIAITTSGTTFALQESLFDAVLPNILPLAVTMGVYGLMQKKWTSIRIILVIVAVGIVGGLLGILAA